MIKTYGVNGKREYIVNVTLGELTFEIHFTNGRANNYGLVPASYMTNNPVVQLAIEKSVYYTRGIVKLIKEVREPIDDEIDRERAAKAKAKAKATATPDADAAGTQPGEEKEVNAEGLEVGGAVDGADEESTEETKEMKEVEVTCVADARQYLVDNFNVAAWRAKSREKATILGEAYGVKFIWPDSAQAQG
ncbi:MAG: hypothetical protein LIO91_08830 [Bacteroidales bacterium]|nr:hypothetical protein [Bacteroidales bacterium]